MPCGTAGCLADALRACCGEWLCLLHYNQHRVNVHGSSSVIDLPKANDKQVGGTHYQLPIQPWDFIVANNIGFLEGNAIKYICRHRKTLSGKKDLEKAIHYLQKAIESYYSGSPEEEKKLENVR